MRQKTHIKSASIFMVCLFFYPSVSLACSVYTPPPPAMMSKQDYSQRMVFIGKVVATKTRDQQIGLVVKPTQIVHIPEEITAELFEFYFLGLGANCRPKKTNSSVPVGSEVKVSVESHGATNADTGNYVMDTYQYMMGVSLNQDTNYSDLTAVYDYASQTISDTETEIDYPPEHRPSNNFLMFEMVKDIKRLMSSQSDSHRLEIIQRMLDFPPYQASCTRFLSKYLPSRQDVCFK